MRRTWVGHRLGGIAMVLMCAGLACDGVLTAARAQDAEPVPAQAAPAKVKVKKAKPAAAGPGQQDAVAPAKDPAVALAVYTSGVKAYQGGKFDLAVQSMNSAVNGGLANNLMPKALYYRGAAFQKLGKPGQAISDLTSALWFKDGLDTAERAEATTLRASAYADAGLSDQGQAAQQQGGDQRVAETGAITGAKPAAAEPSSGGGGIGSLFGNLFGGGSSSKPAAAPPAPAVVATPAPAAVAAPAPSAPPAKVAKSEPEVLPWAGKSAGVGAPATAAATAVAAASPAVRAPGAVAKPKKVGTYRIQVAAVKSRDEASAVIAKLQTLGGAVASAPSAVDETKFGSMGTFFRVRLGPFASVAATKAPCDALKAGGLDCLVTAK